MLAVPMVTQSVQYHTEALMDMMEMMDTSMVETLSEWSGLWTVWDLDLS